MEHGTDGNAMTETALALAMAFFAIMVLTMVSMGTKSEPAESETPPPAALRLLAPAAADAPADTVLEPEEQDTLVFFYGGRFYDADQKPYSLSALPQDGRVILAVDPAQPMTEVLGAQSQINRPDLVVSTMDERWLNSFKGQNP